MKPLLGSCLAEGVLRDRSRLLPLDGISATVRHSPEAGQPRGHGHVESASCALRWVGCPSPAKETDIAPFQPLADIQGEIRRRFASREHDTVNPLDGLAQALDGALEDGKIAHVSWRLPHSITTPGPLRPFSSACSPL